MKKYRNFKCADCGIVKEKRVDDACKAIKCHCGAMATRMISAPRCFGNTTGKSPSSRY